MDVKLSVLKSVREKGLGLHGPDVINHCLAFSKTVTGSYLYTPVCNYPCTTQLLLVVLMGSSPKLEHSQSAFIWLIFIVVAVVVGGGDDDDGGGGGGGGGGVCVCVCVLVSQKHF